MRGSEGYSGSVLVSPELGLVSDARPPTPLGRSLCYPWLLCIDVPNILFYIYLMYLHVYIHRRRPVIYP